MYKFKERKREEGKADANVGASWNWTEQMKRRVQRNFPSSGCVRRDCLEERLACDFRL